MMFVDRTGEWPSASEADKWVSEVIRWLVDNVWREKIYGTDEIIYNKGKGNVEYLAKVHTGGDIIVVEKQGQDRSKGWGVNMGIKDSVRIRISGTDENPETWKVSITTSTGTDVGENGSYNMASGFYIDKDGLGVMSNMSGGYENIPFSLPDGTEIEDFNSLKWVISTKENICNWKQLVEISLAVVVLAVIVSDDGSLVGVLDDGLIVVLTRYIASTSPVLYEYLIKRLPGLFMVKASCLN